MKKCFLIFLFSIVVSLALFALSFNPLSYLEWPSDILLQDYTLKTGIDFDYPQSNFLGNCALRFEHSIFAIAAGVKGSINKDFDFENAEFESSAAVAIRLGSLYLAAAAPLNVLNGFNISQIPKLSMGLIAKSYKNGNISRLDIAYMPNDLLIDDGGTVVFNEAFDPKDAKAGLILYSENISSDNKAAIGLSFIIENLKSADDGVLYFSTDFLLGGKTFGYLAGYSNLNDEPVVKAGIGINLGKLNFWIIGRFYKTFDYNNLNLKDVKVSATLEF